MGDYTPRSSNAETHDDSVLSADRIWPTHTVQSEPKPMTRQSAALAELEAAQGDEDESQPTKRQKTGGRQAGTPNKVARVDMQKSARVFGLRALSVLVDVMEDEDANNSDRISAAKEVLDRGFGKAKQITEVSGIDGEEIQTRLTIEFVGQPPINAKVNAQLTDKAGEIIDMELETVRVPEQRRPWDPA